MPTAEPELPGASARPADPEPARPRASVFTPKLILSLLALWVGASGLLYWISRTDWWLCALGGLGAVLVIWPGPKQQ
jgi:hypothetical protein